MKTIKKQFSDSGNIIDKIDKEIEQSKKRLSLIGNERQQQQWQKQS